MFFEDLRIIDPILKAIKNEGYTNATPIQEQAIPVILEGRDLEGFAQTGTGKTAAFAIPMLQHLYKKKELKRNDINIKALVLAPTRELAIQIEESFSAYGKYTGIKNTAIFGGVSQKAQVARIKEGIDILVATPGRLLDLVQQKYINLQHIEFLVLDEADRMLDMGLGHDVKRIIAKLPKNRQTMLFSATMPKEISKLIQSILLDPVKVEVAPVSSTIETVSQSVYLVEKRNKRHLLTHLLKDKSIESVLVFSRTKHNANRITSDLIKAGVQAQAIHGNKSQNSRQLALSNFKEKKIRVLVATDIAARGIDVEKLSHVINFDLPEVPETYVHRIGRTGRAGAEGIAISFCDEEERDLLKHIEKTIAKSIMVIKEHPYTANNLELGAKSSDILKNRDTEKNRNTRKNDTNRNDNKRNNFRKSKKKV